MSNILGFGGPITKLISTDNSIEITQTQNIADIQTSGVSSDALLTNGSNFMMAPLDMDNHALLSLSGFNLAGTTGSIPYNNGLVYVNLDAGAEDTILTITNSVPSWCPKASVSSALLLNGSTTMTGDILGTGLKLTSSVIASGLVTSYIGYQASGGYFDGGSLTNITKIGLTVGEDSYGSIPIKSTHAYVSLPVGTSGQVLTAGANSTVSWATPGASTALLLNGSSVMSGTIYGVSQELSGTLATVGINVGSLTLGGTTVSSIEDLAIVATTDVSLSGARINLNNKSLINVCSIGTSATNTTVNGIALGASSSSVLSGVALGASAQALSDKSIAVGNSCISNSTGAIAIGWNSSSGGFDSVAVGYQSVSSGTNSSAIGYKSQATNGGTIAIGSSSNSSGSNAISVGPNTSSTGINSVALGATAACSVNYANAIGSGVNNTTASTTLIGGSASLNTYYAMFNSTACSIANAVSAGDLLVGQGSYQSRLALGSPNYVLQVNSAGTQLIYSTMSSAIDTSTFLLKTGSTMTSVGLDMNYTSLNRVKSLTNTTDSVGTIYYNNGTQITTLPLSSTVGAFLTASSGQPTWNTYTVSGFVQNPLTADMDLNGFVVKGGLRIGAYASISDNVTSIAIGSSATSSGASCVAIGSGCINTVASTGMMKFGASTQVHYAALNTWSPSTWISNCNTSSITTTPVTLSTNMMINNYIFSVSGSASVINMDTGANYLSAMSSGPASRANVVVGRFVIRAGVSAGITLNDSASVLLFNKSGSTINVSSLSLTNNTVNDFIILKTAIGGSFSVYQVG